MASEYCMLCAAKQLMEANMALAFGMIVFLILVVPSLLAGAGLSAIIGCLSVGTVASALLARWYRRRCMAGVRFNFGPEMKQVVGEILGRNILPYAVYGVAFTLLQADTIIIGLLGGAAMVAEFVLVWKIAEIMLMMIWKISEGLQPNMIEANVKEDAHSIRDFYRFARYGTCVLALFAGIFYALLGPEIVALWVGKDNAPSNIWYYVAAGGAIFWLANARVSSIFAYTLKQFKILNLILVAEVIVKLSLIAILISTFTFGAPMIVINIVHLFGAAWAYLWLGRHVTPGKENKT
jgi:O-antigen/teichoic acid export membrane protein